jgi:hypothetical protein
MVDLDDGSADFSRVEADLKAVWTRTADGEPIVIADLAGAIAQARLRTSAGDLRNSGDVIPVVVCVLEPAFTVIDRRRLDGGELIVRSPRSKSLADALRMSQLGSSPVAFDSHIDFAVILSKQGGILLGHYAFPDGVSLAKQRWGVRCVLFSAIAPPFVNALTVTQDFYCRTEPRLSVNLTYDEATRRLKDVSGMCFLDGLAVIGFLGESDRGFAEKRKTDSDPAILAGAVACEVRDGAYLVKRYVLIVESFNNWCF